MDYKKNCGNELTVIEREGLRVELFIQPTGSGQFAMKRLDILETKGYTKQDRAVAEKCIQLPYFVEGEKVVLAHNIIEDACKGIILHEKYSKLQLTNTKMLLSSVIYNITTPVVPINTSAPQAFIGGNQETKRATKANNGGDDKNGGKIESVPDITNSEIDSEETSVLNIDTEAKPVSTSTPKTVISGNQKTKKATEKGDEHENEGKMMCDAETDTSDIDFEETTISNIDTPTKTTPKTVISGNEKIKSSTEAKKGDDANKNGGEMVCHVEINNGEIDSEETTTSIIDTPTKTTPKTVISGKQKIKKETEAKKGDDANKNGGEMVCHAEINNGEIDFEETTISNIDTPSKTTPKTVISGNQKIIEATGAKKGDDANKNGGIMMCDAETDTSEIDFEETTISSTYTPTETMSTSSQTKTVFGGNNNIKESTDEAKKNDKVDQIAYKENTVNMAVANILANKEMSNMAKTITITDDQEETNGVDEAARVSDPVKLADMTRSSIQKYVWETLTVLDLALRPTPCRNHNPHFKGTIKAIYLFSGWSVYNEARLIRVSCDKAMEEFRLKAIKDDKQLVYSVPNLIEPVFLTAKSESSKRDVNRRLALSRTIFKFYNPLDIEKGLHIDIYAVSSIAVDVTGRWIGKSQKLCNVEFLALKELGLISKNTFIVTFVSERQIFEKIPDSEFNDFSFSLDAFVTPSRTVHIANPYPHPSVQSSLDLKAEDKALIAKIVKYYKEKINRNRHGI